MPYPSLTKDMHHKIELVVALKSGGRNIPVERALACIYGYGVGIDLTRRDLQIASRDIKRPWEIGKAFDIRRHAGRSSRRPRSDIRPRAASCSRSTVRCARTATQSDDLERAGDHLELSEMVELAAGDIIMTGTPRRRRDRRRRQDRVRDRGRRQAQSDDRATAEMISSRFRGERASDPRGKSPLAQSMRLGPPPSLPASERDHSRPSLGLHRLLHLGARSHAIDIGFDVRPFGQVDLNARGPAQHREQIGVGDGELVARQILLAGELLVEPVETLAEVLLGDLLKVVRRGLPEKRSEVLCISDVMKLSHSCTR